MRSSIITLVLLLSIGVSWAGDRNRIIALGVRNFTYTPKEGKETVGSAFGKSSVSGPLKPSDSAPLC